MSLTKIEEKLEGSSNRKHRVFKKASLEDLRVIQDSNWAEKEKRSQKFVLSDGDYFEGNNIVVDGYVGY